VKYPRKRVRRNAGNATGGYAGARRGAAERREPKDVGGSWEFEADRVNDWFATKSGRAGLPARG